MNLLRALLAAVCLLVAATHTSLAAGQRPNIIVILADDMGFSDLGCYGGEIRTPNLDRLATEGMRFSRFYNCALCGPSRAALMTGLHPHQAGITRWTGLLNNRCVTAFELLKGAGYATCAVGRLDMVTADNWHEPAKIARYVDRFWGSTGHQGPGNYFYNVGNTAFFRDGEKITYPAGEYKTDLLTDFAAQFIRDRDHSRPFFLYMAHYAPHWPLHAKEEDIAKYRALYRQLGWDEARHERHQRLIDLGMFASDVKLAPRDARAAPWRKAEHRDWEAERMATYAAQIDALDQSVGRMLAALRDSGTADNTLIFFLSDNGASDMAVGQLDKPGRTWRSDGTPTRVGNRHDIQPGPGENFVTAGPAWSNVSNAPFRQHKNCNHEGGIASPLVAWWPGVIKATGSISAELSHITDVTATCLDVAGVAYPSEFDNRRISPLAGRSLLPVLKGNQREGHPMLAWATSDSRAIRIGDWKLVSLPGKPWELYDLSRDRTELNNLASHHPERVNEMAKRFEEWRAK
jgi:arylsulfatase